MVTHGGWSARKVARHVHKYAVMVHKYARAMWVAPRGCPRAIRFRSARASLALRSAVPGASRALQGGLTGGRDAPPMMDGVTSLPREVNALQ